ncbi:MAG: hypothetical protein JW874_16415 [Spirochaetales bacterium]|nr:hypothetical protein [Spirochaetales bacterium]
MMTTSDIIARHENLVRIENPDREMMRELVRIFARACRGNPLLEYILGPGRRRAQIEKHYFRYMLRSGIKYGHVFALTEDSKPYAFGMMVSDSNRLYRLPFQLAAGALRLLGCGLPVIIRSFIYEGAVNKIRRQRLPKNHLYGYFLAVDPEKQRDAFRSAKFLLEGCRLWAKEQDLVFYFETMSKRHQIYYSKHGFRTTGEFQFARAGITFYSMEAK